MHIYTYKISNLIGKTIFVDYLQLREISIILN